MHWPNLKREQAERLAAGAAGLLAALVLIAGIFALLTHQSPVIPEFPALLGTTF
jgi:hypothetical protein